MLNKKKTAERARLRFLLALPLAGGMLCASTVAFTKDYGYVDLLPEKSESTLAIFQDPPQVIQSKQINPLPPVGRKPARAARPLSPNKRTFITQYEKDKKTGTLVIKDQRLVLVNGNVMDLKSFYGVTNAETIHYSGPSLATKKFGLAGKSGAVEITGKNLRYFKQPVESSEIKFPPPVLIERRAKPAVRKLQVEPSKIIAADTIKEIRLKKGIIYASATRKVPLRLANSRVIEFREIPQRHTDSLRKVKLKLNPTRAKKNEIIEIRLKEDEKPKELIFQLKEKPAG